MATLSAGAAAKNTLVFSPEFLLFGPAFRVKHEIQRGNPPPLYRSKVQTTRARAAVCVLKKSPGAAPDEAQRHVRGIHEAVVTHAEHDLEVANQAWGGAAETWTTLHTMQDAQREYEIAQGSPRIFVAA